MEVVRELNYIPNTNARNLKLGRSNTIMILVKTIANAFFQQLIDIVEQMITLRGFTLEIRNVNFMEDEIAIAKMEAQNANLAGIVICGGVYGYSNEDFLEIGIPCVLVTIKASDDVDCELYSSVLIDDRAEMMRATEHMIKLGHRRIGCIYSNVGAAVTPNVLRFEGYKDALRRNQIPFDPNLVSPALDFTGSGFAFGFKMMKLLMEKNPDMTAVVTMADIMSIGAAKAALTAGRSIPEDISVIGFDGIEAAEYYSPALDTIAQPAHQMAQGVVDALIQMIHNGKTSHIILKSDLIERGSSAKVK